MVWLCLLHSKQLYADVKWNQAEINYYSQEKVKKETQHPETKEPPKILGVYQLYKMYY